MKNHLYSRLLCLILAAVIALGLFPAVSADTPGLRWTMTDLEPAPHRTDRLIQDTDPGDASLKSGDPVRVSIVLEDTPTLRADFCTGSITTDPRAAAYDLALHRTQKTMERTISELALAGQPLDVVWNLTALCNIISANVPRDRIDAIRRIPGVRDVVIERQYETQTVLPNTAASGIMIGASGLWQTGLTGAGTRIAVIDTGTDTDHQSFDNGAFLYSLERSAEEKGMAFDEYTESLDLLDSGEIAGVLQHLNAYERIGADAAQLYRNEKLPFAANYVDFDLNVDHDRDSQGSHGSHVAGIAAANRFIPRDGGYADALETVFMTGVAPDAQIITMKVFGNAEGPFDSDYFAAIEDAIWLGCDSVNLSLGSASPGGSENPLFAELLDYLASTDTVVVTSAGNAGAWADTTAPGALYHDGVSFHTAGVPGTYTNTLDTASVDNDGIVGNYLEVAGRKISYTEGSGRYHDALTILDTSYDGSGTAYDYIFIDGIGLPEDYEGLDLFGKVVFCARGGISFAEKAATAAELGAAAVVVCNNTSGILTMDLSDYRRSTPCVSIRQQDAAAIRAASTAGTTEGGLPCRTGSLVISGRQGLSFYDSEYYTMSSFSSWGVPGSLELKPEITAPGGNIWSVNGMDTSGTAYELMSGTSMAAPQAAGMAALVAQYIRENGLDQKTGLSARQLAQSLLMSTAVPLREEAAGGAYYPIPSQGAGLARVDLAVSAESYVLVEHMPDGKVKAELGEDAQRTGCYEFSFTIHDLSGRARTYHLGADLFTQALSEESDGTRYLSKQTRSLPVRAQFFCGGISLEAAEDGFSCDLNGDGITNASDGDHLLEYLVGNTDRLCADGDVSGDGVLTSYDAQLLLTKISAGHQVQIPANGSATIQVRLELTEEARSLLDGEYPAGAYLEGFVHAAPAADDEGALGVSHSIPILGYYGSWTESSMYDVGSYAEHLAGNESRTPYLYNSLGFQGNHVSIRYGGREEYLFGGNPYVREDAYLPQRNAFNNQRGWTLQTLRFSLIRSACASMLLLENADTGERYWTEELGQLEGAYYHINSDLWQNIQYPVGLGLGLEGFAEGTRLNLTLLTAPELYCSYDPAAGVWNTDWDALGEGASFRTTFTIDNTAPQIQNVELGEDNILRITAKDNQYLAAAELLTPSGTAVLAAAAANQMQPGEEMTIELDLSQVYGSEFLVAVYDYAENSAVCTLELELENPRPRFTAIDAQSGDYIGFDADGATVDLAPADSRGLPQAAEYVEGAVFQISGDQQLYVAFDKALHSFTNLGALDPTGQWEITGFLDLAYNRCDGRLYTLFYSQRNSRMLPYLAVIDLYTGSMTVLGQMPIDANTLAIDDSGSFYSTVYGTSQLYCYHADVTDTQSATLLGELGSYKTKQPASLAWDHNTDELYWLYPADTATSLLKLDPASLSCEQVCKYPFRALGLYIAYPPEADLFAPTDTVLAVSMAQTAHTVKNNPIRLCARVIPWNVRDSSLIWTSSDPEIASVDENGLVMGLSAGTAVITAVSRLDSTMSASCTVTVSDLDTELKGLIWDEEGQVWWSSFQADSLPAYQKLSPSDLPLNTAMVADGTLYCSALDSSTGGSTLYRADPDDFDLTEVGSSSAAFFDMAYSPSTGYGLAVYFNYVLAFDLQTGEYRMAWDWAGGHTADLVGISYYGSAYNASYGTGMDYFLLLDADGNVYLDAWIAVDDYLSYFNGPLDGYTATIGPAVDTYYLQGFHYDGSYAYWTRFCEAEDAVELIVWDCDGSGESYSLGRFDAGVWPVGGLYTDPRTAGSMGLVDGALEGASVRVSARVCPVPPVSPSAADGSLNAARSQPREEPLRLALTAPDGAEAPTNGTMTVTFDPNALVPVGAAGTGEAFAWRMTDAGTIAVAFANRTALGSGEALTELLFRPLGTGETTVTVCFDQWNQGTLSAQEEIPVALPMDQMPFTDVPADSFYYDPVLWAISGGITTGTSETTFDPSGDCLRASVVTFLWRASGCPEPRSDHNPFTDVQQTDFFYKAVLWAVELGITNGTAADTFSPYAKCNRAQVVTFLWRAMAKPAPGAVEIPFSDVAPGQWYTDSVLWAVDAGITNGMGDGSFGVEKICNRAQVVTFLYRTYVP